MVGSHLLYELTLAGKKVKAIKRESGNIQQVIKTFSYYTTDPELLFNRIEWVDCDLLDYFGLEKILDGVTEIYHCAAIVSFDSKERKMMIANNVEGTATLVNAAIEQGIKKLCHVSSVAALGRLGRGQYVTEDTNWVPSKKISGYSESKFFSETEIWRGIEEGLDAVIVNPSIIIGPSVWDKGSPKLFKAVWDGLKFYTKGVTGFVDVKDVVKAMVLLMENDNFEAGKNQRYLLNSENLSYKNVFFQIADALGKARPKYFVPGFFLGIAWRAAKIASLLNGKPSMITRDSVANSNAENVFDGSKIIKQFNFNYLPISGSIIQTSAFLKKEMPNYK